MWQKVTVHVNDKTYTAYVKQYDEGSQYGIAGGRISKLQIKDGERTVVNYDKGWDIKPKTPEERAAVQTIIGGWNN